MFHRGGETVEKWILAIDYHKTTFVEAQREWHKYGKYVMLVSSLDAAIAELPHRNYVLIAIFSQRNKLIHSTEVLRRITSVPILTMDTDYHLDTEQKLRMMHAVRYAIWPGTLEHGVEIGSETITRFTGEPCSKCGEDGALCRRELLLCPSTHKVFASGNEVHLSRDQYMILHLLLSQAGQIFSPEDIYQRVYGNSFPEDIHNAVRCQISRIRAALRQASGGDAYIRTVRKVGYKIE